MWLLEGGVRSWAQAFAALLDGCLAGAGATAVMLLALAEASGGVGATADALQAVVAGATARSGVRWVLAREPPQTIDCESRRSVFVGFELRRVQPAGSMVQL